MSITWNGVSSDTIGVIVERIPNRYVPTRRFSPQQVAGRNGNILLVDKAFPNVEQEYEVYLSAEAQGLPSVARACAEWLMGPDGYCRLTDSYDTTVYREAFLMGGFDIENILNKFGRCTITFSCKPQKYLLAGDTPISIPAGTTTTYTGDVVQFDVITGASITSLSATISPIQDLHGYSSPWPAGGGVNIMPTSAAATKTNNGVTIATTGNGVYTFSGTALTRTTIVFDLEASLVIPVSVNQGGNGAFFLFNTSVLANGNGIALFNGGTMVDTWGFNVENKSSSGYVGMGGKTINKIGFTIIGGTNVDGFSCSPMFTNDGSTSASAFIPYSNICPITGRTGLSVYVGPTQDVAGATTYAIDWTSEAGTVYGGGHEVVSGELSSEWANIPSYNGETITEPWLSSMDAYTPGATPTTGAQVVYKLATPLTYQLTPQEIGVLVGTNYVWLSDGDVSLTVTTTLGGIVTNPTPFEARPMLEVSGVGEITVNGKSIQILESVSDFEIDCETMEAEDNSKIYCMDFPELSGGENVIVGDGSITALTVTPRWWTL